MQRIDQFVETIKKFNTRLCQVGRVPVLLLCLWLSTLWWGERSIFSRSAAACAWPRWESWPTNARPHHVLLIADPQLVDPHTYPDRPWPLSSLTVWITDLYLRRTYGHLLDHLNPHTTLFLGDLFDGGREWGTGEYISPEPRYQRYGTKFWLQEYSRFMNLYVKRWHHHALHTIPSSEGRRLIASLPGNHDLGFATGIDLSVRRRFDAYFGPLNRIDILGNHTFVSVDTVSLSAMDQIDPTTGSSGVGDGTGPETKSSQTWSPVMSFLKDVDHLKHKAVVEHSRHLLKIVTGKDLPTSSRQFEPELKLADALLSETSEKIDVSVQVAKTLYPTVLLSHVPLYRNQDTSCGPLREKGLSIPLSAGYQYQNVLTPLISSDLVKHLDPKQITQIYSGDDHDYCEIEHGEFTGRIREITVKSTSMAMGIRRPGVQLASLWNPIDLTNSFSGDQDAAMPKNTIQNHLCLLPFMEGIIIRYAEILIFTIISLLIRAAIYHPQMNRQFAQDDPREQKYQSIPSLPRKHTPPGSSRLSPTDPNNPSTPTINTFAQSRRTSTSTGNGINTNMTWSVHSRSGSLVKPIYSDSTDDWGYPLTPKAAQASSFNLPGTDMCIPKDFLSRHFHHATTKRGEFVRSLYLVAIPTLSFYVFLLWNDR